MTVERKMKGRLIVRCPQSDEQGQHTGYQWMISTPVEFSIVTQDWERRLYNIAFEVVGIEYDAPEATGWQ